MRLAWCTDIHVNFLHQQKRESFYDTLKDADGVLISGDIDEAPSIVDTMKHMVDYIQKPIYFVLGNHDYYNGDVDSVRTQMRDLVKSNDLLHYLTDGRVLIIDGDTIITGVDGWADTRYGNVAQSHVALNDEYYIKDLKDHVIRWTYGTDRSLSQWDKRKELADHDAQKLLVQTTEAIDTAVTPISKVIILTHIPPFPQVSKHRGALADDNYLPFYASKATGDVLLTLASKYPDIIFRVFCGHTHGEAIYQVTSNMCVRAGESKYGFPSLQEMIVV